ncbi:CutC family protein [Magnaporthiopsis poae ATCC 64411]|uniref:Copper homeostasis protein cutC homolog n=1 Tax=Magnaporthiopsis poae (strain ATCC 64411 / 73-15) TaxID=644358 RepID=A0A0C4DVK3_MAGP6|nr:CutC family protein [Magnaporthiopsis poae ATCC 64411]
MPQHKLEIPIFSPAAAKDAASLGAHRIELNAAGSYPVGGLTPSLSELSALLAQLGQQSPRIPIRIMIRPRGAPGAPGQPDFIYSAPELASMRDAIAGFKASGLLDAGRGDGFVFGALLHRTADGHGAVAVDVPSNSDLVTLARPFPDLPDFS